MAEGHLPTEPKQDVQADARHRRERERAHDEDVIAVRESGEGDRGDEGGDEQRRFHTFFSSARPKSPLGIAASAMITSGTLIPMRRAASAFCTTASIAFPRRVRRENACSEAASARPTMGIAS